MTPNFLVLTAIIALASATAQAKEIQIFSPDQSLLFNLITEGGTVSGKLTVDGQCVIKSIPMSITIDGVEYPGTGGFKESTTRVVDQQLTPIVPTIGSTIREHCSETLIQFNTLVALRIRVYNDGAAFRWESQINKDEVIVNDEKMSIEFAADYQAHYPIPEPRGFYSHQERRFTRIPISTAPNNRPVSPPLLIDLGAKNLLLTDVNVENYPGLWVEGIDGTGIQATFPPYPAKTQLNGDRDLTVAEATDFLAKTSGTRTFPWRAFVITDDAGLLTSTMLYTLAEPSRLVDTSWIKPGKVSWDWWNFRNVSDVPFKSGINQATYKAFIDFAANNNLQYIILDEGWSVKGPDNLLNVVPAINMEELVAYGTSKNVDIILWMTSTALETSFDTAFDQFTDWGIKGIKVDFMQRDDQVMMDFCEDIAIEAAQHKLLVDFHGGSKPTGLHRTYPNVITHESVQGLEQNKWSKNATPDMAVLLPFTRMVVGPMDYTPGAMDNYTKETFRAVGRNPGSQGTRCHQLAMYVVYLSPLQMLADTPTKYRKNPECMPFLTAVPTTWDETVVLHAEVGKSLAVARRKSDTWYVGAMTDWTPRELEADLAFLGKGEYTLKSWSDGPNAATQATDTTIETSTVSSKSKLTLKLAPGGGYAAILEPNHHQAMLAPTPPMGWNSWNSFEKEIDEKLILETADIMVSSGMRDAGYEYLVIDDAWMADIRDTNGALIADPEKFPNGMKAVGDYIHSKGLKFGIYECRGHITCQDLPGSFEYEEIDMQTFADWGVDYIKLDSCFARKNGRLSSVDYAIYDAAIKKTGRPMILSISDFGQGAWIWGGKTMSQLWRTSGDIYPRIKSVYRCAETSGGSGSSHPGFNGLGQFSGPGFWNDPDMLQVGNLKTAAQDKVHFSLWSILAAPLMAGNDLRAMTDSTKDILLAPELIAVNQDPRGVQGYKVYNQDQIEIYSKPLSDGTAAVLLLNKSTNTTDITVSWDQIGLKGEQPVRDLWERKDLGMFADSFTAKGLSQHEHLFIKVGAKTDTLIPRPAPTPTEKYTVTKKGTTYLSDLYYVMKEGAAPALDTNQAGEPIVLNNVAFKKGLGCKSESRIMFKLAGNADRFKTTIGMDANAPKDAKGTFTVMIEDKFGGTEIFKSEKMSKGDAPVEVDLDVSGLDFIMLEFTGKKAIGNWADARVIAED